MRAPYDVSFAASDGVKLHGWHFRAPERPPKALIVFFHGNGENVTTHFASLAWVLHHDYSYFIFDYRGYGRSEGSPSPEGTVLDGMAALRAAGALEPGSPIVVFAQSLGGAVALRALIELKGEVKVRGALIDSSFVSYRDAGAGVLSKHWVTWLFQPLAYVLLSDSWAPRERVSELAPLPLAVMHGDADQVIGFELGEDLYRLAGEPKEFWPVKGGHHIDAFWRHGATYHQKFLDWLDRVALKSRTKP